MSSNHATVAPNRRPLPAQLASPRAKLVYLYLRTEQEATIDDLHEALGMAHISLYPILRKLASRGFVEAEGDRYRLCE
ncbi:helix-turn-helix domain-containing protein [Haladaptatus sp. YSMS36]|uniref:helix-turn-helix domain-containing protein n=1 Tax=Haladaptatus sp. YSMS36 TaxID=3033384 RepID=UPI0023E790E5|nr:helix-turn-helix domain-containing protein [Haladaptatus sp. YSMS36]